MDVNTTFNNSHIPDCPDLEVNRIIFLTLLVLYTLLTPLFGYVLYIGGTEWKKQRSGASKGNLGHSDVLTFNMIAMESVNISSLFLLYLSLFHGLEALHAPADFLYMVASTVQASFHCLICLERYAAVVHPVAYLRLRNRNGAVVRNVCVAAVWLLGGGCVTVGIFLSDDFRFIFGQLFNASFFLVVSFCSVSVLRVLIRPGPGDGGGDRRRVDQSKRAAFNTIMIILGALLLRFLVILIFYVKGFSHSMNICVNSLVLVLWFKMPSTLVLPLLFLHRAGKLPGCRPKT